MLSVVNVGAPTPTALNVMSVDRLVKLTLPDAVVQIVTAPVEVLM